MGIFPLPRGFGGITLTKEWVLPLAGAGAEASILPEGGVFGGPMGAGGGEPEAESSAVTESSGEMMGVVVEQGDQTIPLLLEAVLPVRHEARVRSTKKSPSGVGSGAQKRAVRPMRAIWPPQTRRLLRPRKECSPKSLLLHHHREPLLHRPQPAFPPPEAGASSLPEECHHAGGEGAGGPLHPFVQAGALPPSPWLPKSFQQLLCHQVRSL